MSRCVTPAHPTSALAPARAVGPHRPAWRRRLTLGAAALLLALPAAALEMPPPDGYLRRLAEHINDYRAQHGLAPLSWSDDLTELAAEHTEDMVQRRELTHDGFRERRRRTASRICVENLAHNFPTPEALLNGWRLSPAHHRNLLEPKVLRMGLAAKARYVTFFACH